MPAVRPAASSALPSRVRIQDSRRTRWPRSPACVQGVLHGFTDGLTVCLVCFAVSGDGLNVVFLYNRFKPDPVA